MQKPAFIAFTGVDDPELLAGMVALSRRYPVEWGILVDEARAGRPLFPPAEVRAALLGTAGLRFAAHLCGPAARAIIADPLSTAFDPAGYRRVQLNHGIGGSSPVQVDNAARFGRRHGVRVVLQCGAPFPSDGRVDWLFDISFGQGVQPARWPELPEHGQVFCGISGGIGPGNAADLPAALSAPDGCDYWIDMESGVRNGDRFDLGKCEAVCRAVFG